MSENRFVEIIDNYFANKAKKRRINFQNDNKATLNQKGINV